MSQASQCGNILILSGQVASGETVRTQARSVFESIEELLKSAGRDKSNIIYSNIFLVDMDDYSEFNEVWDEWVSNDNGQVPSRAAVQVVKLAKPEWRVEVQVFACV